MLALLIETPGSSRRVLWKRLCPSLSIPPSVLLPGYFLRVGSLVFCNFGMALETHLKFCLTKLNFLKNFLFLLLYNLRKWVKNRPKIWFFEIFENSCDLSSQIFFFNESIYYLLFSLHKFHVWEKSDSWDMSKMLSADQIGFLIRTNWMNSPILCTNSCKFV